MIYGTNDLEDLDHIVDKACGTIKPHLREFDSIVVRGLSGLAVGSPVALKLKKPLVIVRKPTEDSHNGGGHLVNACRLGERWVFLDDFINTGATQAACREAIMKWRFGFLERPQVQQVARYLYSNNSWIPLIEGNNKI